MNPSPISRPESLVFFDLANGTQSIKSMAHKPLMQSETQRLMLHAQKEDMPVNFQAGMSIYADLAESGNGAAGVTLTSAFDALNGQIKAGDPFCYIACAISERRSQSTWAEIQRLNLKAVLTYPKVNWASALPVPSFQPWVASFKMPCMDLVRGPALEKFNDLYHVVCAALVNRCYDVYLENQPPEITPEEF